MRRPLIDEQIRASSVLVAIDDEPLVEYDTQVAIDLARDRGAHLLAFADDASEIPHAFIERLRLPLVWERGRAPLHYPSEDRTLDERLWCTIGFCDGRHFLLASNHTHPGRIRVACPAQRRTHTISLYDITSRSDEAGYWLRGFLSASAPFAGDLDPSTPDGEADLEAWYEAEALFLETGVWSHVLRACRACGALRLPSSIADDRCMACAAR